MAKKPGYLLHADPNWVQFHLENSQGGAVGYCRGPGAPMNNVVPGGKLFFMTLGAVPKEVAFWADFDSAPLVTVNEAWRRFGRELGAGSQEDWASLVSRLPRINQSGQLIVVRGTSAQIPDEPIRLIDCGVGEVNNAAKGWSIGQDDVDRLLDATSARIAADIIPPPAGRVAVITRRIVRDTAMSRRVKASHGDLCQICAATIDLPGGIRYSEGHHIQPLGGEHNGPDVPGNILCLCPNHHAMCDLGAIKLVGTAIRSAEGHTVESRYIDYHNRVIYRGQ